MKEQFKNYNIYIASVFICALSLLYFFFSYPYLSNDCGYYLQVMQEMYNGNLYFKDIASPYNPLGISILSIPKTLIDPTDSRHHLFINILVMLLSSFILFKILNSILQNKKLNILFCIQFFTICLIYDGAFLMLEPTSILFLLLALYCYLKQRNTTNNYFLFCTGIFISLSFFSKQYALFILLPIGIDLILNRKQFIKKSIILGLGVAFPIALLFAFYSFNGVDFMQYIKYISGKGVNLDSGNGTGLNSSFNSTGLINYLVLMIFVLFVPYLLKNKKQDIKNKVFFVLLLVSAFSVFIFASYYHYFQYLFPFTLILIAYALSSTKSFSTKKIFHASLIISTIMLVLLTVKSITGQKKYYERQAINEKILLEVIPKNETVYISGIRPAFYHLGNYKSINLKDIGYSFPGYFFPETIIKNLQKGNYLVLTKNYLNDYEKYLDLFEKETVFFKGKKSFDNEVFILKKK